MGEGKLKAQWYFVWKFRNDGHEKLLKEFPAGVGSCFDLGDPWKRSFSVRMTAWNYLLVLGAEVFREYKRQLKETIR